MNRTLLLLAAAGAALALVLLTSRRSPGAAHTAVESAASASAERADLGDSSAVRADDERTAEPAAPPATEREAVSPTTRAAMDWHGIHGRIVFPPGTPFGERVRVVFPRLRESVTAAEDGTFRTDIAPQPCRIDVEAAHLYLPTTVHVGTEAAGVPVVLEPSLGGRIVGHVRRTDGAQVAGELLLEPLAIRKRGTRSPREWITLSGEGAFHFDALPPGRYRLSYSGAAVQPEPAECTVFAGRVSVHDVELRPGASVTGRIVDGDGNRVVHAWITLPGTARELTVVGGEFELAGVPPGPLVLAVGSPGFLDARFELGTVEDGEERNDVTLRLSLGHVVEGRAVWPDGAPARARITWRSVRSTQASPEVETAPDGTFRITGLGPEPIIVLAESERSVAADVDMPEAGPWNGEASVDWPEAPSRGHKKLRRSGHASAEDVAPGSRDVLLVLHPPARLEARLVDEHGEPVRSARVRSRRVCRVGGELAHLDHAVRFVDTRDGRFVLAELSPGTWELDVLADGFAPLKGVRVHLPASEPLEIVLRPR